MRRCSLSARITCSMVQVRHITSRMKPILWMTMDLVNWKQRNMCCQLTEVSAFLLNTIHVNLLDHWSLDCLYYIYYIYIYFYVLLFFQHLFSPSAPFLAEQIKVNHSSCIFQDSPLFLGPVLDFTVSWIWNLLSDPSLENVYCSSSLMENCTKFGQLILSKIIKIVANRCQISRLKCTKFNFG